MCIVCSVMSFSIVFSGDILVNGIRNTFCLVKQSDAFGESGVDNQIKQGCILS